MRRALPILLVALACGSQPARTSDTWRKVSSTPESRFEGFAVSDSAHLYYIGGIVADDPAMPQPSPRIDILLLGTNRWSRGPDLPADSAKHHLAVTQYQGKIYVLGGFDGILGTNMPFTPKATTYVLEGPAWRKLKDAPIPRGGARAEAIGGKIYLAGGAPTEEAPSIAEVDVYDPQSDTWAEVAPLPTPREHVASCVINGKFVVIGGWNEKREVQSVVEAYDPATNAWARWPDLPTARGGAASISQGDHCYVIGGETFSTPPPGTFGANEMYDPMSERWAVLAPMPTARHGLGLTLVAGEIWAVGGGPSQGNSYTTIIEAYRPP